MESIVISNECIKKLFVEYEPERFGIVKPNEQKFIQDYLGITNNISNDDLIRLRNAIVNVYADNYVKQYPDVLNGNDLIKYADKMSAFTCVIDSIRIKRGLEV